MTSLAFDQVRVDYAKRTAVASFTDTVKPGEWLCIIGPNGAGKSTLLDLVAGGAHLVEPLHVHHHPASPLVVLVLLGELVPLLLRHLAHDGLGGHLLGLEPRPLEPQHG